MRNRIRFAGRLPVWTMLTTIGAVLILLQLGDTPFADRLIYARAPIGDGDWWRLLTGNLVHAGWSHLAMNLAALAVAGLVVGDGLAWRSVAGVFVGSALATTLGLWFWSPEVDWYLGASGALHGLFVFGALVLAARRDALGFAVLILIGLKIAWEQGVGALPGSATTAGIAVIVDAHLFGALGGLVLWMALRSTRAMARGPKGPDGRS